MLEDVFGYWLTTTLEINIRTAGELQSSWFPADFLPTERVDIRPEKPDFRPVRTWGDRPVNKRSPLYYRTSLLPLTPIRNHTKQGNGYRWPHIALGWPVFFWAKSWRTREICPFVYQGFVSFGVPTQIVRPKSKQNSPNPSKWAKIGLERLNSGLSSIFLAP